MIIMREYNNQKKISDRDIHKTSASNKITKYKYGRENIKQDRNLI